MVSFFAGKRAVVNQDNYRYSLGPILDSSGLRARGLGGVKIIRGISPGWPAKPLPGDHRNAPFRC